MVNTIYKNVRIITGTGEIIENGAIVVKHIQNDFADPGKDGMPVKVTPSVSDRIEYAGAVEGLVSTGDAEILDLAGCTALPGLIDCDTRLDALNPAADDYVDNIGIPYRTFISFRNAAEALNCGVTTLRAQGMPNNIDLALRDAIGRTMFFGPSVLTTGPVYGVTAGKGHEKYGLIEASGTDALRAQMRIHISRGIESVALQISGDRLESLGGRFHKQMSDKEIDALVRQAKGAEKKVFANASGDASVMAAVGSGVSCIQQGYEISGEALADMAEKKVSYVPCLVSTLGTSEEKIHQKTVSEAIKAGVTVGLGTDILPSEPMDGTVAVIREMELLVEAGMTPVEAIEAATVNAAAICGCDGGRLRTGGPADFVIVEGQPDKDISAMRHVAAVVKSGRRVFCQTGGCRERQFHIHAPLYEIAGGTTTDWTEGAVKGVKTPENYNHIWNAVKEI